MFGALKQDLSISLSVFLRIFLTIRAKFARLSKSTQIAKLQVS